MTAVLNAAGLTAFLGYPQGRCTLAQAGWLRLQAGCELAHVSGCPDGRRQHPVALQIHPLFLSWGWQHSPPASGNPLPLPLPQLAVR